MPLGDKPIHHKEIRAQSNNFAIYNYRFFKGNPWLHLALKLVHSLTALCTIDSIRSSSILPNSSAPSTPITPADVHEFYDESSTSSNLTKELNRGCHTITGTLKATTLSALYKLPGICSCTIRREVQVWTAHQILRLGNRIWHAGQCGTDQRSTEVVSAISTSWGKSQVGSKAITIQCSRWPRDSLCQS